MNNILKPFLPKEGLFQQHLPETLMTILKLNKRDEKSIRVKRSNVEVSIRVIVNEFKKFEAVTSRLNMAHKFLEILIGVLYDIRDKFVKTGKKKYVDYIKCETMYRIDKIAKFVKLEKINWGKLSLSLILFSKFLYFELSATVHTMYGNEKRVDFDTVFEHLKTEFGGEYTFNNRTTVHVWDCDKFKFDKIELKNRDVNYNLLNTVDESQLGELLYRLI